MSLNKFLKGYGKWQKLLIILFITAILFLNILSIYNRSLMWDEKCYIGSGKYLLITKNFLNYNALSYHPPLSFYLNSILLLPMKFGKEAYSKTNCYDVGSSMVLHSGYNPFLITFLARLPFILVSIILSLLVLKFSEKIYGNKSAVFAMFLYTFSTSILSNSNLALTDLLMTFTMFLAIYYFWKLMRKYSLKLLFLTGIFFGLALLSKITSLIIIPCMVILAFIEIYSKNKLNKKGIFQSLKLLLLIFLIGFAVVWAGYGFSFKPMSESLPSHYVERVYQEFNKQIKNEVIRKSAVYAFEKVPIPSPAYFFGLASVYYRSAQQGREGFFFGEVIEKAPWYYLIVVFMLKTQISLLILIIVALIFFRKIKIKSITNEYYLIVPIIILFISFMLNKMVSSVGHILPIYPFLFVFVSEITDLNKKIFRIFLAVIVIHYFLSGLLAFPNYYSYFNEFAGGSANGYKYLGDGNLDNGQNLPQLKEFMIANNIKKINLSYLGSVDPKEYGVDYDYMPSPYFQVWVPDYVPYVKPEQRKEDCSKRNGWIAVSASNFQGVYLLNHSCFSWLKDYKPVETIANAIFVYNITS